MKRLLPIGSVVLLKEAKKRVMIYGRAQKDLDTGEIFDYISCIYPEGNIDPNKSILFNDEDIESIFFIGFQDIEEINYSKMLTEKLSEYKKDKEIKKDK